MNFPEYARHVCQRPGMFVVPPTFDSVCAHFAGFDVARDGGPLNGLREWLVLRTRGGNNLAWWALAKELLQSGPHSRPDRVDFEQREGLRQLGLLLDEFFEYRSKHGVAAIFEEYSKFCRRRKLTIS